MAGKIMKPLAVLALSVAFPGLAAAEDVFIRVEAKRGAAAAEAAGAVWQSRVEDLPVVTFPISASWTAIGLGPLPRETAEARMAALKAAGAIPADSLLTPAEGIAAATLSGGAAPGVEEVAPDAGRAADGASTAGVVPAPAPITPAAPSPDRYLRIEAFAARDQADAALDRWRETLPEAGMWTMPNGWFAIALGPFSEDGAQQWLEALKTGGAIPEDSLIETAADMGTETVPGTDTDWALAPADPPAMPPMNEAQAVLKWAGFYDGEIDGQSGPKTRAAIAAALAAQRATPDAATALANLADRRAEWRAELGLETLLDTHTGLSLTAPMQRLAHDRNERALSIYGPRDESGAALILFSQPGGQQEMEDLAGLVTALGWVPSPTREIGNGRAVLSGRNDTHIGRAESRVSDGIVEGWVLIWPVEDEANAPRMAREIAQSFTRAQPPASPEAADAAGAAGSLNPAADMPDGEDATGSGTNGNAP